MSKSAIKLLCGILVSLLSVCVWGETAIYTASFTSKGERVQVDGTSVGLDVNLPGGAWLWNGGWNWSPSPKPYVPATYDNNLDHNSLYLNNEFGSICLPLASTDTYEKPSRLTVTSDLASNQGVVALGFWATAVRVSEYGATIKPPAGFTGISYDKANLQLKVYEQGVAKVSASVLPDETKKFQNLSYTIDTETGKLQFVMWNGVRVPELVSEAFTDEQTAFVGVCCFTGSRGIFTTLSVTDGAEVPQAPVVTVSQSKVRAFPGDVVTVSVHASVTDTGVMTPVTVSETDCAGYSFSDGVLTWKAGEPGMYRVVFESVNGVETGTAETRILVSARPTPLPEKARPVLKADASVSTANLLYAGTVRPDAADTTDSGLVVNLPQTSWYWNTGYDWAVPSVSWDKVSFSAGNEFGSILLSLAATEAYVKPQLLYVRARLRFSGAAYFGFWARKAAATESSRPTTAFTGLAFDSVARQVKGLREGMTVTSSTDYEVGDDPQIVSFWVDLKHGRLYDVVCNGWPLENLEITGVDDAVTRYVGVGAGQNSSVNSRMSFESLEVYDVTTSGLIIVVR